MNKLQVDNIINYKNKGTYRLTLNKDTTINLSTSSIKLYILTTKDITLNINIKSKVEIYNFTTTNINVNLNLFESANVFFYQMTITDSKIVNNITANHKFKQTVSNLICHGISYKKGDLKFIINGIITKKMRDSICNQTSRIVNLDDATSTIEPNLYISEFNSTANHAAFTGPFSKELLFYLETKGINEHEAYNLLLKAFLKVKDLPKDYEEVIDNNLNKIIRRW